MAFYVLTTTIRTENGRNVWFPIETPLSIEELRHSLAESGCILVTRIETDRRGSTGEHRIVGRVPFLGTLAGIASIAALRLTLTEDAA